MLRGESKLSGVLKCLFLDQLEVLSHIFPEIKCVKGPVGGLHFAEMKGEAMETMVIWLLVKHVPGPWNIAWQTFCIENCIEEGESRPHIRQPGLLPAKAPNIRLIQCCSGYTEGH